jgi:hypothetical protein
VVHFCACGAVSAAAAASTGALEGAGGQCHARTGGAASPLPPLENPLAPEQRQPSRPARQLPGAAAHCAARQAKARPNAAASCAASCTAQSWSRSGAGRARWSRGTSLTGSGREPLRPGRAARARSQAPPRTERILDKDADKDGLGLRSRCKRGRAEPRARPWSHSAPRAPLEPFSPARALGAIQPRARPWSHSAPCARCGRCGRVTRGNASRAAATTSLCPPVAWSARYALPRDDASASCVQEQRTKNKEQEKAPRLRPHPPPGALSRASARRGARARVQEYDRAMRDLHDAGRLTDKDADKDQLLPLPPDALPPDLRGAASGAQAAAATPARGSVPPRPPARPPAGEDAGRQGAPGRRGAAAWPACGRIT